MIKLYDSLYLTIYQYITYKNTHFDSKGSSRSLGASYPRLAMVIG